jgi:thiol-disulfide isomerase/thioredoxin
MKILKFGAVWCMGCIVMAPRWKEIEKENPWLEAKYHDFDLDKEMVDQYEINKGNLPVFIFLDKNGQELERMSGEIEKKKLVRFILENKDK